MKCFICGKKIKNENDYDGDRDRPRCNKCVEFGMDIDTSIRISKPNVIKGGFYD